MNNRELVPRFRFPEFINEEQWNAKPLSDLSELITKGTTPTTSGFNYTESGVHFVKIESINEGAIEPEKTGFISIECHEAFKRSQLMEDDILFSIAGALGVVAMVKKDLLPANTNQALSIIRLKDKKLKGYVKEFLKSDIITREIKKIKAGAAQPNISLNQVANFAILIPQNNNEQQKIASFLSSIDDLIDAETAYLTSLQNHKKGLMQKLFPQEGEKVPKLRFKEFEGDWAAKKLGEVFSSYSGGTPSTTEKGYYGGNIPFIRSAEIHKSSTELYLTEEGIKNSSAKMVEKGDLLIAMYGANSGEVAISRITGAINQAILCLKSEFSNEFTCQYFIFKKDWITTRFLQGGQGNLSGDIIKSIEFYFPSKEEQQKIASFLSSLDDLIAAQTQKIEQLKLHKKGLTQGLFPKMED